MPEPKRDILRKGMVVILGVLVVCTETSAMFAQSTSAPQQGIVRSAVEKQGVGKRVGIRLSSGDVLYGRITRIGEHSFTLRPDHTRSTREIAYDQVTQLRGASRTLLWAVLGVSVVAIVVIVIALARTPSTHST